MQLLKALFALLVLGVLCGQAALAQNASDRERTHIFARYSLIGALAIAAGALVAGLPDLLVKAGMAKASAMHAMFYLYGTLGLVGAAFYSYLPHSKAKADKVKLPKRQKAKGYKATDYPYKYV